VVVSDSPVPVAKIDTACKSNNYQRITSLFRGFFLLKQIFSQVTGEDDFNFINI
jgi:hypothetical protein